MGGCAGPSLFLCWFVNLTQPEVTWEERTSAEGENKKASIRLTCGQVDGAFSDLVTDVGRPSTRAAATEQVALGCITKQAEGTMSK